MKTILLVEDDPAVQRGIRENLEREHFKVLVERDGKKGLLCARREHPDLVILDVMLPSMTGFEICSRLKGEGFASPIFMLTGLADEHSKLEGLGLGADDYLAKPFSIRELLLRVKNLFERTERTLGSAKAYKEELEKARVIQRNSLPSKPPRIPHLDIGGVMIPATHVGGDYFDYLQLDSGRLCVIVADVSGKGMPAALYVQKMQGVLHASRSSIAGAADVLLHLQRHIGSTMDDASFITATAAVVDLEKNHVEIASAGHPPVLLKRKKNIERIDASGMFVGPVFDHLFEQQMQTATVEWKKGDLLLFYSDGVTECMNAQQEEFGEERLREFLASAQGGGKKTVEGCCRVLQKFSEAEPQADDITVVAVEFSRERGNR